ncbi:hypothetical protein D0Z06_24740, partial [Geodermatophilus marinus]
GSVRHVEAFRMGSVRTSIFGRPRRLSRDRRASPIYTLNYEEPVWSRYSRPCLMLPMCVEIGTFGVGAIAPRA